MRLFPAFACLLTIALLAAPASAAPSARASTTKEKKDDPSCCSAYLAFDGLLDTAWAEDAPGTGRKEWLSLDLGTYRDVDTLSIWGGNFTDPERYDRTNRPALVDLEIKTRSGTETMELELPNRFDRADVQLGLKQVRSIKITIREVYSGRVYDDTMISEVALDFRRPPDAVIDKVKAWTSSTDFQRKQEAFEKALTDAYIKVQTGDREEYGKAYELIADAAAHGPRFVRDKIKVLVPYGYRKSFILSSDKAREYLITINDGRGVDALALAAAGARKRSDLEEIRTQRNALGALLDLNKAGTRAIPNWGTEGIEQGALRGMEIPLSLDIDADGRVFVADTANNRLQMFNRDGRSEKVWGADRGLAQSWFGDDTIKYAAGSVPGSKPGEFVHPLAVCVGQWSDFAVIDASNRVQIFDNEGALLADFVIPTEFKPTPSMGLGSPIIGWNGDDFYFFLGDEFWVYDHKGNLRRNGELSGGPIKAAVVSSKRMLVKHDEKKVMEYTLDGLLEGEFTQKPVPDDGSEGWDFAVDEKDNLHVLTDSGKIHVFNKRGKHLSTIDAFEYPRPLMRFAFFDNVYYITVDNRIERVDAP